MISADLLDVVDDDGDVLDGELDVAYVLIRDTRVPDLRPKPPARFFICTSVERGKLIVVMQSLEAIYQESVKPLPVTDQLRLAEMIMKRARQQPAERRSILEIIKNAPKPKNPRTAAQIDEDLRKERDSWDD